MSDYYIGVDGNPITKKAAQDTAKAYGMTLDTYLDTYGYTLADRNESNTDNNFVDNSYENPSYDPDLIETEESTEIDPKDAIFDVLEREDNESIFDEIQLEKTGRDVSRISGYEELFELEEEPGKTTFESLFPGFKFEESTGATDRSMLFDVIKVTSPDDKHSIWLEMDISDSWYNSERKSRLAKQNYDKLKSFVKEHTDDPEALINAREDIFKEKITVLGEREVTEIHARSGEQYTTTEKYEIADMSVEEIYNTSHVLGGAAIDQQDIDVINADYGYDPETDTYDLSIFDKEKRKVTGLDPMDRKLDISPEYLHQPYEQQLKATRESLKARAQADSDYKWDEEDVMRYTAMNLREQAIRKREDQILEDFIDNQPYATQGIMSAYNLEHKDKEQKESIKKSILAENKLRKITAAQGYLEGIARWYNSDHQWNFGPDFKGEVVHLENGKIIPKEEYTRFLAMTENHNTSVQEAIDLQKQAFEAQEKVKDRQAQWDLLRRDYDIWSKTGANIGIGTTDILVGGVYGLHKLSKLGLFGVKGAAVNWLIGDWVDEKVADYYGWSQRARQDFQRDVAFEDAFSDGKFAEFFMSEMSKQIPIVTSIILSGGSAAPYVVGTYSMGQEFMRMEHGNRYLGADHSEWEMYMRSVGYGTAESVLGTLPTVWILGRGARMMSSQWGKEWAKNAGKQFFMKHAPRSLVYAPLIEAGSEGATTITQNMITAAAGDMPWANITDGFMHSAVVGGMMGLTLGGVPFAAGAITNSFMGRNETLKDVIEAQTEIKKLEEQARGMDKRTNKYKRIKERIKEKQDQVNDLFDQEFKKWDYLDLGTNHESPGLNGYKRNTRAQGKIYLRALEIENDPELSEKAKQRELGKLQKEFADLQAQRDAFRDPKAFGNRFHFLKDSNPGLYTELEEKAKQSFDTRDYTDKQLKDEMQKLYWEHEVKENNKLWLALNKKLGRKAKVSRTVDEMVDILKGKIDEIVKQRNNLSKLEPTKENKEKIDRLNSQQRQYDEAIGKIKAGITNGYQDPFTKEKFVIEENQIKNQKVYTGVHELGHDIFEDIAINDPTFFVDLAEQILAYVKGNNPSLYNRMQAYKRLKKNRKNYHEEFVMEFLEDIAEERVDLKEQGYLSSIIGFIVNSKSDTSIPFKSKQDTIEWLVTLAKKMKKGTLERQELEAEIKKARDARKQNRTGQVKTQKETTLKESASDRVQEIYDAQGPRDGAWDILKEYEGMANKLANKYRDVPGFDRQLLVDEILTGQRGVYELIQSYNPKSGVPLAAYINKYIGARSIEAANRILKTNFEQDISEARGVAAEVEEDVTVDNQKQRNSKLRRALNVPQSIVENIRKAVEKTFGTRLPNIKSKEFKKALEKAYKIELKTIIQNMIGTRVKFKNYLEKNWETIYRAIPQSVINKRFKPWAEPVLDENGKQKREKTAQGNAIFKKKNITKEEFVNYFLGDNVGASTKGTRKDALAETLAVELAFDATMEVIQTPEVIQRRRDIQELFNEESIKNEIAIIAKEIDRDPTIKFSEIAVPKGMTMDEYLEKEFLPQAKQLDQLIRDLGWSSVYEDDRYKAMFNEDVWEFVDKLHLDGKVDEAQNTKWKQHIKNQLKAKKGTGQEAAYKALQEAYDARLNEDGETKGKALSKSTSKNAKNDFHEDMSKLAKELGVDVMDLLGFEILGYVNRVLDPAEIKKDSDGNILPGVVGEFHKRLNTLKDKIEKVVGAPGNISDTSIMNVKTPMYKGGIFKKILKILHTDQDVEKKLIEIKKLTTEIEAANMANLDLFVHIIEKIADLNTKGDISDLSTLDFLQIQSNIVAGLRGLSRLDFIQVLDRNQEPGPTHPQWKEAMAYAKNNPRRRKNGTLIPTEDTAKAILAPKGEHVGPWLQTALKVHDAIMDYKYVHKDVVKLRTAIREAIKDHTQYLTNILDTKKIDNKKFDKDGNLIVSGSVSDKSFARLRQSIISNIYGPNGEGFVERTTKITKENQETLELEKKGNYESYLKMSESLNDVVAAIKVASNPNAPRKGISVIDFDDTLAFTDSKIIVTMPDGTVRKITPAQFALEHSSLEKRGAKFDYSEFNDVKKGRKGPFFNKAKSLKDKFGNNDIYILTARPQAAAPAIQAFLKGVGLDIKLENIVGLENGTPEAKAGWMLKKAGEGFNDFLFADDAIKNVKAVKKVLDAVDVKSKVYQAGQTNAKGQPNLKFSENLSDTFNEIIQDVKGLDAKARYSDAVAKLKGAKKGNWNFYLPPSAQDFALMLYNFVGKGKIGNAHWKFFHEKLIKPYNKAIAALDIARQQIHIDYQNLLKDFNNVKRRLNKTIPDTNFTYQQAIRVYLWNKFGFEIPGLSKRDQKNLVDIVKRDRQLMVFADKLSKITGLKEGYTLPNDVWIAESILTDLHSITDKIGRSSYLKEFNENVDQIFSKENLNKIEALFGKSYRDSLEDSIYRMKNGTNRSFGSNKLVNDILGWVNNSVGATMFINIRSATLQMLSFVNFINWSDNNIFKAAQAFANFPNYVKHVIKIFNSPKLKQRRSGLRLNVQEAEMAEAANKGGFKGMLAYLLKIGFTPTRAVDSLAISVGGATMLINRTKTYLKQGMSKAEAEAKAWEDFSEIAERTQQSADPSLISPLQAGGLGRFLFAWQNTPFQYNRLMKMAGLDLYNRRITPPYTNQLQSDMSNVSKIIYYGAIQNFIFSALQSGLFALLFDEDDLSDEEKQAERERNRRSRVIHNMADTILRGSGLPGAIASTIKNIIREYNKQEAKGFTADHTYTLIQAINLSPTLGSKARLMYSGIQTRRFEKDVIAERGLALDSPIWEVIASQVQWSTNIPMNRAVQLLRNTTGALDERNALWQRIFMGLGWNYYDFNVDLYPEHQDIKDKAKEKRKEEGKKKAKETRERNKKIKEAAEAHVLSHMSYLEQYDYEMMSSKEKRAWLKKKVEEYLNK